MSNATTRNGGALALLDELTRRGVVIGANGDRLALDAPKGAIGDLLPDLARFKPELLELLTAQPVHRWRVTPSDTATPDELPDELPDVASDAPANAQALEWTPDAAAQAILDGAYFNLADGGVWRICWSQPSRGAWQWAAIENGGTLDETTGLPSMEAADAITWARAQKETI